MSTELLPCPFCGSEAKATYIGNDRTKSRKIEVKCQNKMCRITQVTGAIRYGFDWLDDVSCAAWNRRFVCLDKNGKKVFAGDELRCHVRRENRNDDDPEYDEGTIIFDQRGLIWRLKTGVFQKSIVACYDAIELIESDGE